MGLYSDRIFPWLLEKVMSRDQMREQREIVLAAARGRVLEIGFGTGLNLPHYPEEVQSLAVLDPNAGMHRKAASRIAEATIPIESIQQRADEAIAADAESFDTVISTWTMCSIPDLPRALGEIARVLKPGGKLLFIEHGLAEDPKIARWQHRLNPVMNRIGDGCNLNRNIARFIRESPLAIESCDQFCLRKASRVDGWTYRGVAVKQS